MGENENKVSNKKPPLGLLFDVLGYDSIEEYEEFIKRTNNGSTSDILLIIVSALRYAQSRGVFKKLEESEAVATAVRKLTHIQPLTHA